MEETNILQIFLDDSSSDDSDLSITSYLSSSSSSSTSSSCRPGEDRYAKKPKISNFMEVVYEYTPRQFKQHFRLPRECVENIIENYESYYNRVKRGKFGRRKIGHIKEIYITLWYMANTETYRQISDRFDVARSCVYYILRRVIHWFVLESPKYIKWPTEIEQRINESKFRCKKNFPLVIGAIDGSHIRIKNPLDNKLAYLNRKKYSSILMQAVVDADKKFLDIYCGEPGSIHDARLFRRSTLFKKVSENPNYIVDNYVLLGDSAYPQTAYLVTPFRDFGTLSNKQKKFNYLHSATRIVVEHTLGILKQRFRRLKYFESPNIGFVANCVVAACVLHNICIDANDLGEWIVSEDESELSDDLEDVSSSSGNVEQSDSGENKRNEIFRMLDDLNLL